VSRVSPLTLGKKEKEEGAADVMGERQERRAREKREKRSDITIPQREKGREGFAVPGKITRDSKEKKKKKGPAR